MPHRLCAFELASGDEVVRKMALHSVDDGSSLMDIFLDICHGVHGPFSMPPRYLEELAGVQVFSQDGPDGKTFLDVPWGTTVKDSEAFGKWFRFEVRRAGPEDAVGQQPGSLAPADPSRGPLQKQLHAHPPGSSLPLAPTTPSPATICAADVIPFLPAPVPVAASSDAAQCAGGAIQPKEEQGEEAGGEPGQAVELGPQNGDGA
eukprot:evm.model.scf_2842.1 EVM.evm.TU.scf_2842.1   scf_2842:9864-12373(-)